MALAIGNRIGSYEITGTLSAGGWAMCIARGTRGSIGT